MAITFALFLFQKQVPLPSSCIEVVTNLLIDDNIEIRRVSVYSWKEN